MAFLKQVATRDIGGAEPYATGRLVPATPPVTTAYTAWIAAHYTPATRLPRYDMGKMMEYQKILKRSQKLGATAMAA
jgi:hypothetical protein